MTKKKTTKKKKVATTKVTKTKVVKTKKEEPHSMVEQITEAGIILQACNNNEEVAQFFLLWLKNGRDASKAYSALHPNITNGSAKTGGWRLLTQVDRSLVAQAYGLGYDEYFKQLKEGLNAEKLQSINFEIHKVADHKTRRDYHKALGEIIGTEKKEVAGGTAIQVNVGKAVDDWVVTD